MDTVDTDEERRRARRLRGTVDFPHTDPRSLASDRDTQYGPERSISERFRPVIPQEEPWLRLPDEPIRQWRGFVAYRDLGIKRTTQRAADIAGETHALTRRWLTQWEWAFRVEQFDRYISRQSAMQVVSEHAEMLTRHTQIAMVLQEKALQRLNTMDPAELTVKDTLAFLKEAVSIERATREVIVEGAPSADEIRGVEAERPRVSGDWMGDLMGILAEAGAIPEGMDISDVSEIIDGHAVPVETSETAENDEETA